MPPSFLDLIKYLASARNVIAAILKRLAHRNPNVQLYSLVLAESLSKNCGKEVHSEIASRAFTQALERLVTDRVRDSSHHIFYSTFDTPFCRIDYS